MSLEIDCEVLIKAVEKRSPLYDTTRKYYDRKLKKRLWNEVCQEVYSSSVWNSMSSQNKIKYGNEVQKRWTSLRHCFRREVKAQKNEPSGSETKKKRHTYMYYKSLSFLLPFVEDINLEGSIVNGEDEVKHLEHKRNRTSQAEPIFEQITIKNCNDEEKIPSLVEGDQMPCTSKTNDNGQDEDELFLRSLIPYMKEFSGDQKLLLRMEIIKSILNFKQSLNDNSKLLYEMNIIPFIKNETPE